MGAEVAEGAIGGMAQGASIGAMFGGVGAPVGAVIGGVAGLIKGFGSKKKIKEAEQARQRAIEAMAKSINDQRGRVNAYYTEAEKYEAELLKDIAGQYVDIKTSWDVLGEDQKAIITQKYGDVMGQIDSSMKTQLEMSDEMFAKVSADTATMKTEYVNAIKKDIEFNAGLREELGSTIDANIKKIQDVDAQAQSTLQKLQETGKTVGAEKRLADMGKSFDDASRKDAEYNPNQTGQAQKKLSLMFKQAMAEGDLSAKEQDLAEQQKANLRSEISGNANNLINQARNKRNDLTNFDATTIADANLKFDDRQVAEYKDMMLRGMKIDGEAGLQKITALVQKYNSWQDIERDVAQGKINADEKAFLEQMGAKNDFMKVKGDVMKLHLDMDRALFDIQSGNATQASAQIDRIKDSSNAFMQQGLTSLAGAVASGAIKFPTGSGVKTNPAPSVSTMGTPTAMDGIKSTFDVQKMQNIGSGVANVAQQQSIGVPEVDFYNKRPQLLNQTVDRIDTSRPSYYQEPTSNALIAGKIPTTKIATDQQQGGSLYPRIYDPRTGTWK